MIDDRSLAALFRSRRRHRLTQAAIAVWLVCFPASGFAWERATGAPAALQVGFSSADITPSLGNGNTVWLAGYRWGRAATEIHDPLYVRTLVIADGQRRIAIASVDLVGLQLPDVERIRERLPDVDYVLVSSTHNHEGPDTIGIWGRTPWQRGVDDKYLSHVVDRVVESVKKAADNLQPALASYGTAADESLLGDSRRPIVKDGVLRVLRFDAPDGKSIKGLLVQWNCHPEALGPSNTRVTADFCYATVDQLQAELDCPVVYVTGAVGGLMAPPEGQFTDAEGNVLREGEFEFAEAYGRAVADLAERAVQDARPIDLVPLRYTSAPVAVPIENPLYRAARLTGVLRRKAVAWTGNFRQADLPVALGRQAEYAVRTEVACLRLGELWVACIPGEIYPELVYGRFQDPVEPNVDFPDAPLEPTVNELIPSDAWMLFGLANDEIGYLIPRRQWDLQPPFAYGREKSQYGEINSCSSLAAPIVMEALGERVRDPALQP